MTPKDFHERVYRGLFELRRQAHGAIDEAKIIVHPRTRDTLLMDSEGQWFIYSAPADRVERYRGLVLETDPRLDEDSIRIRYEVEA